MADMDAFERGVAKGLLRLADDVAGTVDAAAVAHRVAREHPRRRPGTVVIGPVVVPRLAWLLLVAGMLFALVVGSLAAGGWWRDRAVVVEPSPTATPVPAPTTIDEATDILATTKAQPLPAQATCPPGSTPDNPGAVDQDRPTWGVMAFDRHAGRIVLLEPGSDEQTRGARTWTYDVCTNTWQRMAAEGPPLFAMPWWAATRLVYDADSDRTLAFTIDGSLADGTGEIWTYDLAADRWARLRTFGWMGTSLARSTTHGTIFYHDPSGLVVVFDGADMWAYDVDTNTLAKVRQVPDPSLPAGSGLPAGMTALGYDPVSDLAVAVVVPFTGGGALPDSPWSVPAASSTGGETWTFAPSTGSWRKGSAPAASDLIVCGVLFKASQNCFATAGRSVFDEVSGLTLFVDRATASYPPTGAPSLTSRIDAYDAGAGAWRTLRDSSSVSQTAPNWCEASPPVYDPLNRRVVCLGDGSLAGVWAFTSATGESRWLLQPGSTPSPTAAPSAPPSAAATVVDEATDILATTKAKPLPAQATCPPGSTPDTPGPVDQDRPTGGEMAFDRHAGVIVVLAPDGGTWAYDVCTNAWQRKADAPIAGYWPLGYPSTNRLLYDADSDRTLALVGSAVWSYDLGADRWTDVGTIPDVSAGAARELFGTVFYHDPSGLVVLFDGADMWAYDVDTNMLAKVRQLPDPSLPAGSGLPQGRIALGYDPGRDLVVAVVAPYVVGNGSGSGPSTFTDKGEKPSTHGQTWTFDPGSGAWHKAAAEPATDLIVCAYFATSHGCLPSPGRAVFDEASGLPAFLTKDDAPGRIDAYDAGTDAWRTLHGPAVSETAPTWCDANPPVYDLLNGRIVCLAPAAAPGEFGQGAPFAGVWAFSSATGESRWLLEPGSAPSSPSPSP